TNSGLENTKNPDYKSVFLCLSFSCTSVFPPSFEGFFFQFFVGDCFMAGLMWGVRYRALPNLQTFNTLVRLGFLLTHPNEKME
ncbi:hypothetical protein, partial [Escherichia coli]|uniref:hypothetical protein n=1 Tax=Escherichia coli TaxID=562 RepID=UPI001BC8634C